MAFNWSDVLVAQGERLDQELAQCAAELEAARIAENSEHCHYWSEKILEIDNRRAALAERANHFVRAQAAAPKINKYGLSDDEVEVAKNSHSGGSVEERLQSYAQQKQKLQWLRATGQYRDDQGSVKR